MGNHSSDPSGANGEDMPWLVKLWEQLIEFETTVESTNHNVNRARDERRRVERAIIGQEPPLGVVGRNEDGGVDL